MNPITPEELSTWKAEANAGAIVDNETVLALIAEVERLRVMFDTTRHRVCDRLGLDRSKSWSAVEAESARLRAEVERLRTPSKAWSLPTLLGQCDNERERSLVRDAYASGQAAAAPEPEARDHAPGYCEACSRDENHPVYHTDV